MGNNEDFFFAYIILIIAVAVFIIYLVIAESGKIYRYVILIQIISSLFFIKNTNRCFYFAMAEGSFGLPTENGFHCKLC